MSSNKKSVTVLVVVRNEVTSVGRTIASVLTQDFSCEDLEIIVVDGMSTDGTKAAVEKALEGSDVKYRIFDNPGRTLASGWNIGIRESSGEYVVRIDAHAEVPSNFLKMNMKVMGEVGAACVGGPMETKGEGFWGELIAGVLSTIFGVGQSFRTMDLYSGYTDTVAYGMYRREVLVRVGAFNEKMTRSQDWEMHKKMLRMGEKIYCDPRIRSTYYCLSNPIIFIKKSFINGYWVAALPNKSAFRHLAPFFFICSIIALAYLCSIRPGDTWYIFRPLRLYLLFYYLVSLFFSLGIAAKTGLHALVLAPVLYASLHISYGLGTLYGLLTGLWLRVSRKPLEN